MAIKRRLTKEGGKGKRRSSGGRWHKWLGLFFTLFILVFALSGIFLNHRRALSTVDIPRSWLPQSYQYSNWNNASIKGSLKLSTDSILLFGGSGIWLTDSTFSFFEPFLRGIRKGADNQTTHNVVKTSSGDLFAVTTFDCYQYDFSQNCWMSHTPKIKTKERLVDIASCQDTLMVLSRSHGYVSQPPYEHFERIILADAAGEKPEVSLFKTLWTLHSGELFGSLGKLLVDFLGLITIILCLTGLLLFFTPQWIRKRRRAKKSTLALVRLFKGSLAWHNKPGSTLFYLLLILCLSGMFLRPPLLISIIRIKHRPLSFTTQDKTNPWHDKLRCIRYDEFRKEWLVYTSDGLLAYNNIRGIPTKIPHTPPISVMGLQVFEPRDSTTWLVGSFSGLFHWDRETGTSCDYFTGKKPQPPKMGPPVIDNPISGFSSDFEKEIVFNYFDGAQSKMSLPEMPKHLQQARMSLWHVCLEAHTGRIYTFLPEVLILLFIPISGILFFIILISGYMLYRKRHKRKDHPS